MKHNEKSLMYFSHPYSGKRKNKKLIEKCVKYLNKEFGENFTVVSPVHTFGFMYKTTSYEDGLDMCLNLLDRCNVIMLDKDWLSSKGCKQEYLRAIELNIPIVLMRKEDEFEFLSYGNWKTDEEDGEKDEQFRKI